MVLTADPPAIELLLRMFRREFGTLLDDLEEAQSGFTWTDAPDRVIDGRVKYPIDFTQALVLSGVNEDPEPSSPHGQAPQFLHAFGNYLQTRTIYTIDRTLLRHLVDSKWPDSIPVEAASLPKNGCVLDLPAHEVFGAENIQGTDRVQIICTYDMNYETGGLDLVLTALCLERRSDDIYAFVSLESLTTWLNLSAANLEEAIADYDRFTDDAITRESHRMEAWGNNPEDARRQKREKHRSQGWARYLRTILSVLMYINGNDDLLEVAQPDVPKALNKSKRRRLGKAGSEAPPRQPIRQFQVGKRFASVIQRWEEEERAKPEGIGHAIRPHLRAAHAHLYWTGKGKTIPRVKFLPPIAVKGWEPPEAQPLNRLVR